MDNAAPERERHRCNQGLRQGRPLAYEHMFDYAGASESQTYDLHDTLLRKEEMLVASLEGLKRVLVFDDPPAGRLKVAD
jgi:hypothetical protein